MGIQVHLRIDQRAGQLFDAVRRAAPGQFVGMILSVVVGQSHGTVAADTLIQ